MVQDSEKPNDSIVDKAEDALDDARDAVESTVQDIKDESGVEDAVEVMDDAADAVEETSANAVEVVEETYTEAAAAPAAKKGFGLFSMLCTALVAAVIGFVAAFYIPRAYLPEWWPSIATASDIEGVEGQLVEQTAAVDAKLAEMTDQIAALEAQLSEAPSGVTEQLAALEARLDETPGAVADQLAALGEQVEAVSGVGETVSALEGTVDSIAGEVEGLTSQVAEIAARPVAGDADSAPAAAFAALQAQVSALSESVASGADAASSDVVTELQEEISRLSSALDDVQNNEELAALQAQLEDQLAENAALAERVESVAASADSVSSTATATAALSQLQSALDRGTPFASTLANLADNAGAEIPEALSAVADAGVPTVASLERQFPGAARNALDAAARENMGEGAMDRVGAFLQSQLKPRALEPQEGDGANAVLSRAEAAVRSGEINVALTEIASLPEAGQAAMAEWVANAAARQAALDAAAALSQSLSN